MKKRNLDISLYCHPLPIHVILPLHGWHEAFGCMCIILVGISGIPGVSGREVAYRKVLLWDQCIILFITIIIIPALQGSITSQLIAVLLAFVLDDRLIEYSIIEYHNHVLHVLQVDAVKINCRHERIWRFYY